MMVWGRTGETSRRFMVPVSFSLTMETEVIMAQIRMNIIPIMPGTKLYALFSCGLYSVRMITGDAAVLLMALSIYAAEVCATLVLEASTMIW